MNGELGLLDDMTDTVLAYRPNTGRRRGKPQCPSIPRAAEFFAGIGLVRLALEQEGFRVVFANDIEPAKARLYTGNFNADDFVLGDVRKVKGADIPDIELATASFPCTDLSLAGNRIGLSGEQSGLFWEFARVIEEMGGRRPPVVLLENVLGFASSNNGKDMAAAIGRLNNLGYRCDILVLDASWFLPQSRPRMFIVGAKRAVSWHSDWSESRIRPAWVGAFVRSHPALVMHAMPLQAPTPSEKTLASYVEKFDHGDERWWNASRRTAFIQSLSPLQGARMDALKRGPRLAWATAYRRTRNGKAVWEVRSDAISGCLRTARGGSSKQAVVEAGRGEIRVRWMTAREYARLQGAPKFKLGDVGENAAMFGFGDAVCVPAVAWIARSYLRPLLHDNARRNRTVT
jgi:DNA (cytosine-5)-methyltransferase 1